MSPLAGLLADVDGSLGRGSGEARARTLFRLTDLLVAGQDRFGSDQVEILDAVIGRFAAAIETRSRVELAERLAPLAKAPRGVILRLADDEIVVARPVLARSPALADQDLVDVARRRGRDHMLAMCERPSVSPVVTDVLVHQGDGVVWHAIVGNDGARFSRLGTETLLDHSRGDAGLQELLGERPDLSAEHAGALLAIARATARQGSGRARPGSAAIRLVAPDPDEGGAGERGYSEEDLMRLAAARRRDEVVAALGAMTALPRACLERIFAEPDNDLLLVIGKARHWSWRTVKLLLQLRDPGLSERHHFRRAEDTFDALASATALRVLQFLRRREAAGASGGRPDPTRLRRA